MDRDTKSLAPDRSGTFLVKEEFVKSFAERNLKIYAERHSSNDCEKWNREMRKEDSPAGTTYIRTQSGGIHTAQR